MINKFKIFFKSLFSGDFKRIKNGIRGRFSKLSYKIKAGWEDFRLGGMSIERQIPSKFEGAHPTESTDYRILDAMFEAYPLKKNAVLVDIGSGEGRILTYLYLRGYRNNRMVGIELDEQATEIAKKRTRKCRNIQLCCANVFDCADIIKNADALFMSNPFGEELVEMFIEMIEKHCDHTLVLYFAYDVHSRPIIDKRDHWRILRRARIQRPESFPTQYTIYRYSPNK